MGWVKLELVRATLYITALTKIWHWFEWFFCFNKELEVCINGAIAFDDITGVQLENDVSDKPNLIDSTISTTTRPVTITKSTSFIERNPDNEDSSMDPFSTTSRTRWVFLKGMYFQTRNIDSIE